MGKTNILTIPSLHPYKQGYRIVFEKPLINLSPEDLKQFHELYDKIQEAPKKHIDALEEFQKKHPQVPEVANLLAFAYLRTFKKKEAEALIEKTWQDHPDYLIGQINYAELALKKGKLELIPLIFNHCFDLNDLYPERTSFHYTEFRGFMTLMGFYYFQIKEREKAQECYEFAFQIDPLHSSVASLEKLLLKTSLLKKCMRTLKSTLQLFKATT